jgi:hypothetical protein
MRYLLFIFFPLLIASCESSSFDKDKRQIIAKDEVRSRLPHASKGFDITGFREDTLSPQIDTVFKHPIQYTLDFTYNDSTGAPHQNTAHVIFTPDGKSIIQTQITDRSH